MPGADTMDSKKPCNRKSICSGDIVKRRYIAQLIALNVLQKDLPHRDMSIVHQNEMHILKGPIQNPTACNVYHGRIATTASIHTTHICPACCSMDCWQYPHVEPMTAGESVLRLLTSEALRRYFLDEPFPSASRPTITKYPVACSYSRYCFPNLATAYWCGETYSIDRHTA